MQQATPYGVVAVTGHQEALAAYKDPAMSSCVAVAGPFPPLPFTPEGDDISAQIEEHRAAIPMAEHVVTMDAEAHAKTRGLLSKLITPKRLSENEDFMWRLVDQQLDKFIGRGACEFMEDFAKPLSMLVIADLLGVPTEDHQEFSAFGQRTTRRDRRGAGETVAHNPLLFLDEKFAAYISDRRREPRVGRADRTRGRDVSRRIGARCRRSRQAGDVPVRRGHRDDDEAGQHRHAGASANVPTSNRRFATTATQIPAFLEESLRMESPVKSHFRLARTTTTIGEVEVPAGTIIMMLPGASNRDPRKFEDPTSSGTTARTCASTWRSGVGLIPAPVRHWRARRRASR